MPGMNRLAGLIAILSVCAAAAACSSSGKETGTAPAGHPPTTDQPGVQVTVGASAGTQTSQDAACKLLTSGEIEQALSTKVTFMEAETTPGTYAGTADMCLWDVASGKTDKPQVVVTLETSISDKLDKARADFEKEVRANSAEHVDGLGDFAVQLADGSVGVLAGQDGLVVAAITGAAAADRAASLALAKLAVSRLP